MAIVGRKIFLVSLISEENIKGFSLGFKNIQIEFPSRYLFTCIYLFINTLLYLHNTKMLTNFVLEFWRDERLTSSGPFQSY